MLGQPRSKSIKDIDLATTCNLVIIFAITIGNFSENSLKNYTRILLHTYKQLLPAMKFHI